MTRARRTGVSYVDKATRRDQQVRARAVVVAGSSCESARLLLNSRSPRFPHGLANSSGVVGRYLMDSVGSDGDGYVPALEKMPPHNHDGIGRNAPLYSLVEIRPQERVSARLPRRVRRRARHAVRPGEFHGVCQQYEGYGLESEAAVQGKVRRVHRHLAGRGEMIPNENYLLRN